MAREAREALGIKAGDKLLAAVDGRNLLPNTTEPRRTRYDRIEYDSAYF